MKLLHALITLAVLAVSAHAQPLALKDLSNVSEADMAAAIAASGYTSGGGAWGGITGTLSAQTDLQAALDAKTSSISIGNPVRPNLVADGVADDTAALQAAINLAGTLTYSATVILPVGDIKITSEIVLTNRVRLVGQGMYKTRIFAATAGQNGIWFSDDESDFTIFEDFSLYGPPGHGGDGVTGGVGILADSKTNPGQFVFGPVKMTRVWISRWATSAKIGQVPLFLAENCYFGGYKYHGIHLVSTDTFQFNGCSSGFGTLPIDEVLAGATTIRLEGSLTSPTGTNFAGEFTNCEFGDTWKFLDVTGCRIAFESCNFETRGGATGLVTSNSLFDVGPGARLAMKNCRFGLGSTTIDAGSTPAAVILGDASNSSAEPRIILENSSPADSLYLTSVKYVGANWAYYSPFVIGNKTSVRFYNASFVEQASFPAFTSVPEKLGHDYFVANTNTHTRAKDNNGAFFHYWVGAGDATRGDGNILFNRKTRRSVGGVVQFTRSSLSNDSLMSVMGASVAITSNVSASRLPITAGVPALGIGILQGTGDVVILSARGTCAANANVKTFSGSFDGIERTDTRITITDATAVYWESQMRFHSVLTSTAKMVVALQAYAADGTKVHDKCINVDQSGFTSVDGAPSIQVQSATATDVTCHGWELVWRSNAVKP